jgi:hypothetical protein
MTLGQRKATNSGFRSGQCLRLRGGRRCANIAWHRAALSRGALSRRGIQIRHVGALPCGRAGLLARQAAP